MKNKSTVDLHICGIVCLEHAEFCNDYALSVCIHAVFYTLIAVLITTTAAVPHLPNG